VHPLPEPSSVADNPSNRGMSADEKRSTLGESSASRNARAQARPRWYVLYVALAAFGLLSVSAGLYLNHRLTLLYSAAVTASEQWAQRSAELSALRQVAGTVNAPGNDVFDSHDVDRESARLHTAVQRFEEQQHRLSQGNAAFPTDQRARMDADVALIGAAMDAMLVDASVIFDAFRQGNDERAGQRMASMDRAFAKVNDAVTQAEHTVRDIQAADLNAQHQRVETLRLAEYGLAAIVVIMIGAVLAYGQALSRTFRKTADERDGFVAALQASEARTRAIVDSAGEGIFTFDEHGVIQSANAAMTRFAPAGLPTNLVGRSVSALVPVLTVESSDRYYERLTGESAQRGQKSVWTALAADGSHRDVELTVSAIPVEGGRLFSVVMHDVTARAQMTAALERARQSAEDASVAKSAFLANMSHELRTPLNAIIGYGEMLHEVAQERGDTESADDLERIHTAGKHLLSLINDILDLSKIEAGKTALHIEEVSARTLLSDVEMTVASVARKSGNRLEFHIASSVDMISVDVVKARQILLNLISNACKFTKDGVVRVAADIVTPESTPFFQVTVTDSGIGMTSEQLGRLFKPFSQADASTTRKYGGTGLGLVLSKRFAEILGGNITVTSQEGVGSQFVVRLPLSQSAGTIEVAEAPRVAERHARTDQRGSYVLVIDDDPITQGIIRRQLTKMGITTRAAFTATEALQMAREQTPLAITLDLLLPDQSGVSVMSSLKSDPALAFVPIIVVSIIDDTGAGFALGASEYLVKPVDSLQLAAAMSKLLPSSGSRRVLVVDDDTDARTVMARRASELGGLVTQASNGAEALDAIRHQRPDLILLDLMMPVMDGFGVIDALRADPALRDIAVVVVTARDMADEDVERLRGSVTALVHKPSSEPTKVADEIGRFVLSHKQKVAAHAVASELAASHS